MAAFRKTLSAVAAYVVLAALSVAFLVPFLFMIGTSFKTYDDIVASPLNPIPFRPTLDNFALLFEKLPFWDQLFNSLFIAVSVTALAIVFNSLVAFGFARYDFKYKNALFIAMLSTLLLPPQMTIVPQFLMFKSWGWLNTYSPLVFPGAVAALGIFLIRQIMASIPKELYDSARVDGCSELGTFVRIATPLAASGIAIVGILTFMGSWNDFLSPLIFLSTEDMMTLSVGITTMNNPYKIDYATPITGAFLMGVPVLVLIAVVGHKYFVAGIAAGAIKG